MLLVGAGKGRGKNTHSLYRYRSTRVCRSCDVQKVGNSGRHGGIGRDRGRKGEHWEKEYLQKCGKQGLGRVRWGGKEKETLKEIQSVFVR